MKRLLILLFTLFTLATNATTYYFNAVTGNDSNAGTSSGAAWKTLTKYASFSFAPGDNVLFNRGDVFYGALTPKTSGTSGNVITIGAYGSGANPIISGFTTVSSWTNLGGNIWESTSTISVGSAPNMVLINGVNTAMGRTPNASSGYGVIGSSTSTSVTASALSSGTWTGATIVTKDYRYIINRRTITSQSGSTVNFASNPGYNPQNSWGYFIQNSLTTLDQQDEWYYNMSTHKIDVYSTSMPTDVKVSSIDVLVNLVPANNRSYLTFDGIDFEGANKYIFVAGLVNHVTIQNCSLNFCGDEAILGQNWGGSASYFTVQNCTINQSQTNGIDIPYEFNHGYVGHNIITNTGMLPGMLRGGGGNAIAVNAQCDNCTVEYNKIDSIGYTAIYFSHNNVTINNNFINYYNLIMDDGGGIYTYSNDGYTNRVVRDNILLNGIGNSDGINNTGKEAHGIYMDGYTNDINIYGNTVAGVAYAGLFLQGNTNVTARNNTIYDAGEYSLLETYGLTNALIKSNIYVAKTLTQMCSSTGSIGGNPNYHIDSNYYARPIDDNQVFFNDNTSGTYNLAQWQAYSGLDANSHKSPKIITSTDSLKFVYNATSSAVTTILSYKYIDMKGAVYDGSITLQPYTSAVLIQNGTATGAVAPPTANAGTDQSLTAGITTTTLTGSATTASGHTATYLWTKDSGPSCSFTSSTSLTTGVTGMSAGTYVFKLTVTQDDSQVATDYVTVVIATAPTGGIYNLIITQGTQVWLPNY